MFKPTHLVVLLLAFFAKNALAQDKKAEEPKGKFSGNAQMNYNFYQRDTTIGATGLLYDHALSGGEGWVNLGYSQGTFEVGTRLDLFQNSQLHIPGRPYSGQGIGLIYAKKQINDLTITAGNFYEQFGSGVALRAYEDRALGIDNSLFGLRGVYQLNEKWQVKALTAVQKDLFTFYAPTVKGVNIEGNIGIKDSAKAETASLTFLPGASVVNRTLDEASMNDLVSTINTLDIDKRFVPTYNDYIFQGYNTIQYKSFSLYTEYNYKTREAIRNVAGDLISKNGNVFFGTLGYSRKGFGINAQYKRTENFWNRTTPNETRLQAAKSNLGFLPPTSRQNSLRLPARYVAASQEISEQSFQVDVTIAPSDELSFNSNYSKMTDLNGGELFQEFYQDFTINKGKNEYAGGIQLVDYNIDFFQNKPGKPVVRTFTPFFEYTRRISRKQSLRVELQYLFTDRDKQLFPFLLKDAGRALEKQDYGDWAFALVEFNIAPNWSFAVSDMYNIKPTNGDPQHYPNAFVSYTKKTTRFTLAYAKQVAGIVCTGGVCRFEPAFSGARFGMTTSF